MEKNRELIREWDIDLREDKKNSVDMQTLFRERERESQDQRKERK